ncbi:MAG: hypothetical protein MUC93_06215 [Bacteroidales bacterium]|jgi:hypothetical protein|nr:hypothetical protein [Bacteroidales bacterium]
MKKSLFFLLLIFAFSTSSLNAQGDLLKKVAGSMKDELFGTKKGGSTDPEPSCACPDAEQLVGFSGKLKLDYKEMNISTMDDGSLLLQDKMSGDYYIVRDGTITGPIKAGDPRLAGFVDSGDNGKDMDAMVLRYKNYISKSGDKYLITFGGKTYGPYAQISSFTVTLSKDKFAALVIENIPISEAEGEKMDKAIENAKTEQEKMDLAMQYSQLMQQQMMEAGGPEAMMPKIITNIPNNIDPSTGFLSGTINGRIKYDDILIVAGSKINDFMGKTLINLKPEHFLTPNIFLNTANNKYAIYNYGTITFSDKKTLTDLFNPHLIKVGSQVYLAYMYYSPKKNSMMQCKIPF